jgi:hypothetical protein
MQPLDDVDAAVERWQRWRDGFIVAVVIASAGCWLELRLHMPELRIAAVVFVASAIAALAAWCGERRALRSRADAPGSRPEGDPHVVVAFPRRPRRLVEATEPRDPPAQRRPREP